MHSITRSSRFIPANLDLLKVVVELGHGFACLYLERYNVRFEGLSVTLDAQQMPVTISGCYPTWHEDVLEYCTRACVSLRK